MMKNLSQYTLYLLMGVGVLVFLLSFIWDSYDPIIYSMYVFTALCILAMLASFVLNIINNPGKLRKTALSFGILVLVCVIGYMLASGEVLKHYGEITQTSSKLSGAGLYVFYIMIIGAIGAIVYSSVSKLFK